MSGLFSAVGRGLSAAGYGAGEFYGKSALMDQESALASGRAMRLAEFQEALKNAPRNRLQSLVQREAGVQVPVDAAPVSDLSGAGLFGFDGKAPDSSGFSGDPKALLKEISGWKDGPDKDRAMAQLKAQYGADVAVNQAAVAGKTRARTPDEAFDAALSDAKVNDLGAYEVGKPLASDKTITVADGATIIDKNGKVIFSNTGKSDRALALEDRKDARASVENEARDRRAREAEDGRDRRQLQALLAAEARAQMTANGRPPAGFRAKADGSGDLEFIPGGPADPSTKNKPLPASAAKGLLENQANLRMAQKAAALVNGLEVEGMKGDPQATGLKGYLPNQLLNRIDEKGVATRAAVADLGSMVIHDRSGAAVTASEFPRLAPFIPTAKDDAATVKTKLGLFVQNYQALIDDATEFYKESGYKVPGMKDFEVKPAGAAATPAAVPAKAASAGWGIKEIKK